MTWSVLCANANEHIRNIAYEARARELLDDLDTLVVKGVWADKDGVSPVEERRSSCGPHRVVEMPSGEAPRADEDRDLCLEEAEEQTRLLGSIVLALGNLEHLTGEVVDLLRKIEAHTEWCEAE